LEVVHFVGGGSTGVEAAVYRFILSS
jgi:hypothetical protein